MERSTEDINIENLSFLLMEQKFSEFRDSDKSLKHELEFKDPVFHICLAGTVVGSQSLESNTRGGRFKPFTGMTYIFVTKFAENI